MVQREPGKHSGNVLETDACGRIVSCMMEGKTIAFRSDAYGGFQPYLVMNGKRFVISMKKIGSADGTMAFEGRWNRLICRMKYEMGEEGIVRFWVENTAKTAFKPTTLGLCTGIDCYMASYPQWNTVFFPTMLRCEKSHFWGYNERPDGTVLVFATEEPTAAWSCCYNELEAMEDECGYLNGGHRIYTWNLHLLNRGPLPKRHPAEDEIPGETVRQWTFHFRLAGGTQEAAETAARMGNVPVIQAECYTLEQGQPFTGRAYGAGRCRLEWPDGSIHKVHLEADGSFWIRDTPETGKYRMTAEAEGRKEAEAIFYVRRETSWYLYQGREAVCANPPLHTHHVEAFNCLYTVELAKRYLPEKEKDERLEREFLRITGRLYDPKTRRAAENPWRIQDSAALGSLFALRFGRTGDCSDIEKAGNLADFLMACQGEDGAYYSIREGQGKTHYTAVTYIAKYMMDIAAAEETAEKQYPWLLGRGKRHRESALRAVEELVRNRDNIDTEGERTFEDGMISCSLLQIAYAALGMEEGEKKEIYKQAAESMYAMHECLTLKGMPDSRMNGATLRFWEAQYNVHIFHNMMNSPCGWTCWKIYGTWYLYLLTGKQTYLLDTMNALGACLQLVDGESGTLRWGFVVDPYVETLRYVQDKEGICRGKLVDDIIGEQYVDMVSPWHRTEVFPRKKWAIDNLVHEVFKCLAEVGLENAWIHEKEDGGLLCWNCLAVRKGDRIQVTVTEKLAVRLHCHLKKRRQVAADGAAGGSWIRLGWLRKKEGEWSAE